jgi:tetratricopeptide (TPR) repeat protein
MPTASLTSVPEELHLLARAVEGDVFHFVVVQWSYFTQIKLSESFLRGHFKDRAAISVRSKGSTYEEIMQKINSISGGFVFFEDFDCLLSNPDIYVSLNQRRGMLARKPLTIVAFLPPGAHYVRQCEKNLPDWWSVLSFRTELDFPESAKQILGEYPAYYSSLNPWPSPRSRYRANKLISRLNGDDTKLSESVKTELLARLSEELVSGGFFAEGESFFRGYLSKVKERDELFYRLLVYLARFKHQLGEYRQEVELLEMVLEAGGNIGNNLNIVDDLARAYMELGYFSEVYKLIDKYTGESSGEINNLHSERLVKVKVMSLIRQEDYTSSLEIIDNRLRMFEGLFPIQGVSIKQRWLLLEGECYLKTRQYDIALTVYENISQQFTQWISVKITQSYNEYISEANRKRAAIWFELGDFHRAAKILQEERKRIRPIFGKKHPIMASVGAFLGLIYLQLGHLKKAEKLFSEALQTDIGSYGESHPVVATDMFNLGVTCLQAGDKDRATALLATALKLFCVSPGNHSKIKKAKSWLVKARSPK